MGQPGKQATHSSDLFKGLTTPIDRRRVKRAKNKPVFEQPQIITCESCGEERTIDPVALARRNAHACDVLEGVIVHSKEHYQVAGRNPIKWPVPVRVG